MTVSQLKSTAAFTLIEVMLAILILTVAVIGTSGSGYRYYAALDARRAAMRSTSARIGLLLCESWRGTNDPNTFDPTDPNGFASELTITNSAGPAVPGGFTSLGSYTVVSDGATYYATMSWKDVSTGLRALNVVVA